jgi:hypothetical protein
LEQPNETIGVGDLVVRARYWTVPGSADHAYRLMKRASARGLRVTGYGLPSRSADNSRNRGFLNFQILDLPSFLQGGELYVEMEPYGAGRTIVAAFAEVYAHPVRSAEEHIPLSGATATAKWPKLDGDSITGKVTSYGSHGLSQHELKVLIDGFNRSPVADATGICMGGVRAVGDVLTVTVESDGHVWRLTYPSTCVGLSVTRDGKDMPGLTPDAKLRRLLEVLAHFPGTVVGTLLEVGGPAGRAATPITGKLTLSVDGHIVSTVETRNRSGHFGLVAQPGRYTLTGTSRHYRVNGRPGTCTARHPVVVRTQQKTHADVYCQLR